MIGGLIMAHGDDAGLRVPPRLAPIQVVVLLVRGEDGAGEAAERLARELRGVGVRTELDARTDLSLRPPGRRLGAEGRPGAHRGRAPRPRLGRGHPGPARHGAKDTVPVAEAAPRVLSLLEHIQADLLAEATARLETRTPTVEHRRRGGRGRRRRVRPAALGQRSAVEGEDRLRGDGVTVRCLRRRRRLAARRARTSRALVATVARAY